MVEFGYLVPFSILIPIILGFLRFGKIEQSAKWLLYMLIPVGANQFIAVWYGMNGNNNFPLYYIYIVIELLFLSKIYYGLLQSNFLKKSILVASSVLLLSIIAGVIIDTNSIWESPDYFRAFESLLILSLASAYFVQVFKQQRILYLHEVSAFWMSAGLIIYFACNLMLFAFNTVILQYGDDTALYIWTVHGILNIILYTFFTVALLCNKTAATS